jgi:hypothetical protein
VTLLKVDETFEEISSRNEKKCMKSHHQHRHRPFTLWSLPGRIHLRQNARFFLDEQREFLLKDGLRCGFPVDILKHEVFVSDHDLSAILVAQFAHTAIGIGSAMRCVLSFLLLYIKLRIIPLSPQRAVPRITAKIEKSEHGMNIRHTSLASSMGVSGSDTTILSFVAENVKRRWGG